MSQEDPPPVSSEEKPPPRPKRNWKLKDDNHDDDKIIADVTQNTKRALFPDNTGETLESKDEEGQVSQSEVESKDGGTAGTFKDWFLILTYSLKIKNSPAHPIKSCSLARIQNLCVSQLNYHWQQWKPPSDCNLVRMLWVKILGRLG